MDADVELSGAYPGWTPKPDSPIVQLMSALYEEMFSETIQRISNLVTTAPEIMEMDINPLMGSMTGMMAVDTRIRICRQDIANHR